MPDDRLLAMRDIADNALVTATGRRVGRVADAVLTYDMSGTLRLTDLVVGPQALTGRVSSRLRPVARWFLRDRFEHTIPVGQVAEIGPAIQLTQGPAGRELEHADAWVVERILRFIPGNGRS